MLYGSNGRITGWSAARLLVSRTMASTPLTTRLRAVPSRLFPHRLKSSRSLPSTRALKPVMMRRMTWRATRCGCCRHPMRGRRRTPGARKQPMRREPLPGPDDENGQDSDSENADFSVEADPCMVAAPCPGGRPVLRHTNPGPNVIGNKGRKKAAAAAPWAWPYNNFPTVDHPWYKRPPAVGREARMKPKERTKLFLSYAELDRAAHTERKHVCRTIPEEPTPPAPLTIPISSAPVPRPRPRPSWRTDNKQSKYPRWSATGAPFPPLPLPTALPLLPLQVLVSLVRLVNRNTPGTRSSMSVVANLNGTSMTRCSGFSNWSMLMKRCRRVFILPLSGR